MSPAKGVSGLRCSCGEQLNTARVARSYALEGGGQRRVRHCPRCHNEVASIECVVGANAGALLVVRLNDRLPRQAIAQLVRSLGGEAVRI